MLHLSHTTTTQSTWHSLAPLPQTQPHLHWQRHRLHGCMDAVQVLPAQTTVYIAPYGMYRAPLQGVCCGYIRMRSTHPTQSAFTLYTVRGSTMAQKQHLSQEQEFLYPYYTFAMPYSALEAWLTSNEGMMSVTLFVTCIVPQ